MSLPTRRLGAHAWSLGLRPRWGKPAGDRTARQRAIHHHSQVSTRRLHRRHCAKCTLNTPACSRPSPSRLATNALSVSVDTSMVTGIPATEATWRTTMPQTTPWRTLQPVVGWTHTRGFMGWQSWSQYGCGPAVSRSVTRSEYSQRMPVSAERVNPRLYKIADELASFGQRHVMLRRSARHAGRGARPLHLRRADWPTRGTH